MKNLLILFLFLGNLLFSIDVVVEKKVEDKSQLSITSKAYFGESIFKGNFKENQQFRYNPNYIINVGDIISVKIWGAYEFEDDLTVDKQGNIFISKVGTIQLIGLSVKDLKKSLEGSISKVFNNNVYSYADLKQYQPISVFVSGAVNQVGLYNGLSTDSILQFIDKSGGIVRGQGSFRSISILRDHQIIKNLDLYQFLLNGTIDLQQFKNGDVILVNPVQNFIEVDGDVNRPYIFELLTTQASVQEVMRFIMPKPTANHFTVTKWNGNQEISNTYTLGEANSILLTKGTKLKFFSDYYVNNINVDIEGEHQGNKKLMIKKGLTLYDILAKVKFTPLSEIKNVRLYRKSVAKIQKQLIETMLKDLEARVFTTDSSTVEEGTIRTKESEMVMQFIKRVRGVEPLGQVVIRTEDKLDKIYLEEGDRIVIPKRSNIVVVQGEVNIPNALTFREKYTINDYVQVCGGYGERANEDRVLLIRANGEVMQYDSSDNSPLVNAGDSILVLSKSDTKNILITSSITKILYQIAIAGAVVLRAF